MIGIVPYSKDLSHPADRRRLKILLKILNKDYEIADINKTYDFVFLSEKADLTSWIHYDLSPVMFDLCDAYLFQNKYSFRNIFHGLFGYFVDSYSSPYIFHTNFLKKCCKKFNTIICSSDFQRDLILDYNKNVFDITDTFEIDNITNIPKKNKKNIHIFWEGLGVSSLNLKNLIKIFKKNKSKFDITLVVCSDKYFYNYFNKFLKIYIVNWLQSTGIKFIFYQWSLKNLIKSSSICDFAVIPLNLDNPIIKYKNFNKLLLMWRLGLVTITSASPSYKRLMDKAGFQLYCNNENDWINKIEHLIGLSTNDKQSYIDKSKKVIKDCYSNDIIKKKWLESYNSL